MQRLLPTNLQFLPRFVLIISFLVGASASLVNAQVENLPVQAISFGSTTPGAINTPGERDTFTFSADVGDVILIGASRVSGDLWPEVSLYGPDGGLLAEKRDAVHVEIYLPVPAKRYTFLPVTIKGFNGVTSRAPLPAGRYSFQISAPGTYTILVSDGFNGTYTGSYNLYLQKLNPPGGAAPISYSQTLAGNINQPAEMDAFTFTAEVNDEVIVGMSKVSGDLWQKIRLYDPDGVLLHEVKDAVHAEMTYRIPLSGIYTILAADGFNGTYTGGYNLFLQKLNPPAEAGAISFSETVRGNINQPAEMDTFTFRAQANDRVMIGMTKVSGDFWQKIRLYDPDGELIAEAKNAIQAELFQVLAASGSYTILASDGFNGTYTGSYNLNLQKLP